MTHTFAIYVTQKIMTLFPLEASNYDIYIYIYMPLRKYSARYQFILS